MYTPEWPPNWINSTDHGVRSYSAPDSVIVGQCDLLRCSVGTTASRFVAVFGPCFMVVFVVVCWFGIDDPRDRVAFTTLGLFCGIATFVLIYALMHHHETRGDYIAINGRTRTAELPRHQRTFVFDQILCFQILTGRDKNCDVVNDSDLNMVVAEGENAVRYHLMGNPNPEHAEAIASVIGVPLFRQVCPSGWYRSSDMQNK